MSVMITAGRSAAGLPLALLLLELARLSATFAPGRDSIGSIGTSSLSRALSRRVPETVLMPLAPSLSSAEPNVYRLTAAALAAAGRQVVFIAP